VVAAGYDTFINIVCTIICNCLTEFSIAWIGPKVTNETKVLPSILALKAVERAEAASFEPLRLL